MNHSKYTRKGRVNTIEVIKEGKITGLFDVRFIQPQKSALLQGSPWAGSTLQSFAASMEKPTDVIDTELLQDADGHLVYYENGELVYEAIPSWEQDRKNYQAYWSQRHS